MMPGIAAQPLRRISGGGGGIANSWSLDFLTETYLLNGAPIALADIIAKPERVGASGLEILDHNAAGSISCIGDWFTDLAAFVALGGTVFIEWEALSAADRDVPLYMEEDTNGDSFDIERTTTSVMRAYGWGSDFRGVDNNDIDYGVGIHRVAVTYTPAFIAMSIDGADTLIDTTPNVMNPMQRALLGGFAATSNNALYYRKITLGATVANSLLPALTAPVLASADYRTGVYTVAGVSVALADIVDQPELVDATGLAIPDGGNVVALLGAYRDVTLGNGTRIIEWDHFDSTNNIFPAVVVGAGFDDVIQVKRQNSLGSYFMDLEDFSGIHFRRATDASAPVGDGVHKIAYTRTDSSLEFSIDGRAPVTYAGDPDTFSISATDSCYGGYPGDTTPALTIRSDRMIAAVDSSLLASLSA